MVLKQAISRFVSVKFFRGKAGATSPDAGKGQSLGQGRGHNSVKVRPLESPARLPTTAVERLTLEILEERGEVDFDGLSQKVARKMYLDELGRGAALLDIGLWGPGLFLPEVTREIRARDGELWEIGRGK